MSVLPVYKRMIRGGSCFDPDEELLRPGGLERSVRAVSALPESNSYARRTRPLLLSATPEDIGEEYAVISEPRFTTRDTLERLGDILGRGDDSWLDRYVNNVRVPNTVARVKRVSRVGSEFPIRRRFLTSEYYPYKNALPGFYSYPKDHHWSLNDPTRFRYLYSSPTPSPVSSGKYEWDWAYPHRSYTSNYNPTYVHYPLTSNRHQYLYPRNF